MTSQTNRVIYDPGTKTIIGFDDAVIIDAPAGLELEELEEFCDQDMQEKVVSVHMKYYDGTLKTP